MKRFIPAALVFVSLVPFFAGLARSFGIVTGMGTLEGHARFAADPVAAVVHIIGLTFFTTFGALQFSPALRKQRWHRMAGRVLAPMGIIGAVCGVWMVLTWPPKQYDTLALNFLRVTIALCIASCLAISLVAVRWGDFDAHRRWMTRAYALALAGGTQFFTHIPVLIVPSLDSDNVELVLMSAGWLINIAVAEWAIRYSATRSRQRATARLAVAS